MAPATPSDAAPPTSAPRRRHIATALVVITALAVAGGCGNDDDSTSPGPTDAATTSLTASGDSSPASDSTLPTRPSADTDPSQSPPPRSAGAEPVGADETVFERGDIDDGLRPFVERARTDLAIRLGIDPTRVELLTAVLVVWPNTALGCPDPKMRYAQTPVDGSVIELGVDDRVYRYHTGGSSELFLCERPWSDSASAGRAEGG